jgi:predicted dehydrogenase
MVGQVLRFFPEFAHIKQVLESGEYGNLGALHLKRVISKPTWARDDWFADTSKTGGAVVDLHIHDADFVHYLFGMPQHVFASGLVGPDGQVGYLVTEYLYDNQNRCVTAASGAVAMSGVMFEHGFDAYFERATLRYNSLPYDAASGDRPLPLTIYTEDGQKHVPELAIKDAFAAELAAAVEGARTGTAPPTLDGRSARDSLRLVLAEAESARSRRLLTVA